MPGFVFLSRKVELLGVKIIFLRNVLPVLNFSKDETFLKENWSNRQRIPNRKWSRDRKWSPKWTANDPRPQVIPKVDRKWSHENLRNKMDFMGLITKKDWLQKRTDYNEFLIGHKSFETAQSSQLVWKGVPRVGAAAKNAPSPVVFLVLLGTSSSKCFVFDRRL